MDVSVITVTWNSGEFIEPQISSLTLAAQKIQYEQFVVDNASTDQTVAGIQTTHPEIRLIRNSSNLGFAAANNQAALLATGEYLLFLNPDTLLEPGSLDTLVSWMREHPRAGIVGPALKNKNNDLETEALPRRFPTLTTLLVLLTKLPHLFPGLLHKYRYADMDFSKDVAVDTVRGSCLFIRRNLVTQLGFAFDPRYFAWFEDVDLCREVKRLGYEVWFTPATAARDYVGQSFKQVNHLARQKQFFKSATIYFKKWEPGIKPFIVQIFSPLGIFLVRIASWLK